MLKPFAIRIFDKDRRRFQRLYKSRPSKDDSQAIFFKELLDDYESKLAEKQFVEETSK